MADQTAHDARIIEQFTRWARPFADLPLHSEADAMARLLAAAAPMKDTVALDVACGPGIVACALAEHAAHVTGVDLTPAMIEQARARQARMGLANLAWRVGDASRLDEPDERFDLVVTRYSFHHLLRPGETLAEMARVCRPGGRVVVVDATPIAAAQGPYDRMETLRDPSHASALTVEQLRALARDVGGLEAVAFDAYRLQARLGDISDPERLAALAALFEADIAAGADSMDVAPARGPDGITFSFPISMLAWRRA